MHESVLFLQEATAALVRKDSYLASSWGRRVLCSHAAVLAAHPMSQAALNPDPEFQGPQPGKLLKGWQHAEQDQAAN